MEDTKLQDRRRRDAHHAAEVPRAAAAALKTHVVFTPLTDMARGVSKPQVAIAQGLNEEQLALRAISQKAFDAVLEGEVSTPRGTCEFLWYAHQGTRRNVAVTVDGREVRIVAWTHPALQIGMSSDLGEWADVQARGYSLDGLKPIARARFTQLLPEIAGVYEPGGVVSAVVSQPQVTGAGLKAVKLEMTPEQLQAFLARMNGLLLVTGAPGTGKTTVAFQRIRFLLDQQDLRHQQSVEYAPALTRVFLASRNLIDYSRRLLKEELDIPSEVVSHVSDFVRSYVADRWRITGRARPVTRRMEPAVERAREAMLNLCTLSDLRGVWTALETQVAKRLQDSDGADWMKVAGAAGAAARRAAEALSTSAGELPRRSTREVLDSPYRMDELWRRARVPYDDCRKAMRDADRDRFAEAFASWLYWVYDPLDILSAYLATQRAASLRRIKNGTGNSHSGQKVFDEQLGDWKRRLYGDAELSWIAWLLRFSLPEDADVGDGFRAIPRAIPLPDHRVQRRWTHVVIDEAQDLSVQEASFLASFVHQAGALTVSADFKQVVSPVHGMTDSEALKVGLAIRDRQLHMQFPFRRNLRQSREIGYFLRGFYRSAFGESAPFDPGDRPEGFKPQVQVGAASQYPRRIKQVVNVLRRTRDSRSVAVLYVQDDEHALDLMRSRLRDLDLPVADPDVLLDPEKLVVTTVERAKGLEFAVCVVIGLDDVERAALNFTKNRAYVALSRPTRKLIMLCQQDPSLLHGVPHDLFDRVTFA